jgi:hypothetical protein
LTQEHAARVAAESKARGEERDSSGVDTP